MKKLYLKGVLKECHIRKLADTARILADLTSTHQYPTRGAGKLRTPVLKLKKSEKYYLNRYVKIYNKLRSDESNLMLPKKAQEKKIDQITDNFPLNELEQIMQ